MKKGLWTGIWLSGRLVFAMSLPVMVGLLPAFTGFAQSQTKWSGTAIEVNVRAGKVLKHTNKFLAPIPELTTAYEVNVMQQTYGKREWHQRRKYPRVGVGMTYTNYGIESI